jgi:hypothetical protein
MTWQSQINQEIATSGWRPPRNDMDKKKETFACERLFLYKSVFYRIVILLSPEEQ